MGKVPGLISVVWGYYYLSSGKYCRLNYLSSWLIMFSSKLCHTEDGSHGKKPVKTCCVSDDLSGGYVGAELAQSSFIFIFFHFLVSNFF